jgi:hypothetical protein
MLRLTEGEQKGEEDVVKRKLELGSEKGEVGKEGKKGGERRGVGSGEEVKDSIQGMEVEKEGVEKRSIGFESLIEKGGSGTHGAGENTLNVSNETNLIQDDQRKSGEGGGRRSKYKKRERGGGSGEKSNVSVIVGGKRQSDDMDLDEGTQSKKLKETEFSATGGQDQNSLNAGLSVQPCEAQLFLKVSTAGVWGMA